MNTVADSTQLNGIHSSQQLWQLCGSTYCQRRTGRRRDDLRTPLTSIYGSTCVIIENYDSLKKEQQQKISCPKCGSHQVELVSTPRKVSNWASALIGFFITSYAMPVEKVLHCFDCGHEFGAETNEEDKSIDS